MIRPARFESNPLTAASNSFQERPELSPERQQELALGEFEALVEALRGGGVAVLVYDDTAQPHTPDAIFPNNWVSFHADGRIVLYPMEAINRRTERRMDILENLDREQGFYVTEIVDLSSHEADDQFLEGTGSLVLDWANRIAYACLSSRTHLDVLGDFAQQLDYEVIAFDAVDGNGAAIYHTNVLMCVGEKLAVICDETIVHDEQRAAVLGSLKKTGHEILSLSIKQMAAFAGNMLELRNQDGGRVMALSQQAYDSLDDAQKALLRANGDVVASAIDNIEASAGGSVRCMLAEVHLPRKT
jgi:hypothetical protein